MPIGTYDPGTDWFDLQVNYGGYKYHMFFGREATSRLPRVPPPAGQFCRCPSCSSKGWYAASPACNFWEAHCHACTGRRVYYDYSLRRSLPCDLCQESWTVDVREFRYALRSPRAAAQRLREEAAAQHARNAAMADPRLPEPSAEERTSIEGELS